MSSFDCIERFDDGYVVLGDSTHLAARDLVVDLVGYVPLVIADPPYGNILFEQWDRVEIPDWVFVNWMLEWTSLWKTALLSNAALYVWGGVGVPGFRPFFKYLSTVEETCQVTLSNLITWSKKRAYGTRHNYLFTREELAYFVNGPDAKKPHCFNVPLLAKKRGYAGYDPDHPALSEYYRRTNVWTDVTEIMRGKQHPAQKAQRVIEIPIEVHTSPGEWVVDPFAGSGTTALACRALGRKFFLFERDRESFDIILSRLKTEL